jgi:hypothetical protein
LLSLIREFIKDTYIEIEISCSIKKYSARNVGQEIYEKHISRF